MRQKILRKNQKKHFLYSFLCIDIQQMLICNIMDYGVCIQALNKLTIMEIKVHYELI